ncbi:hypothetical protein F8388_001904 [Cannabis sativa]|uniref:Uncharacterized protein n=1 Tax=Cannabis sativa TaxID=3483 RepID=A0A7J6EPU1_CANSA|nr:hypothetical protein F8388_001904 [Cannabis sativa]
MSKDKEIKQGNTIITAVPSAQVKGGFEIFKRCLNISGNWMWMSSLVFRWVVGLVEIGGAGIIVLTIRIQ